MEKYVVSGDDGYMIAICDTKADAEELILAMCEEEVYEDYFYEVHRYDEPHNEVIREMIEACQDCNERNEIQALRYKWVREQHWHSWYAWALNDKCEFYKITGATYLGG